jgi:hypothetical protein
MYQFRLQRTDGSPFDLPTYRFTTLSCRQGDTIMLTRTGRCACSASVTTTPTSRRAGRRGPAHFRL